MDDDKRIQRLERTVDALAFHLRNACARMYILSAELCELKGRAQHKDPIATTILRDFNAISTLKDVSKK